MFVILLAEDTDDTRYLLKYWLESFGYQVIEACDGKEALDLALAHQPDLILMDIGMPEMDGIEATKVIRSSEKISEIPIIAVTAHSDKYQDDALAAGCNIVVEKPLDIFTFHPVIKQYLKLR